MNMAKTPLAGCKSSAIFGALLLAFMSLVPASANMAVPKDVVLKELGEPRSIIARGNKEYLLYNGSLRIELTNGVLTDHRALSERQIRKFQSIAEKLSAKSAKQKPAPKPEPKAPPAPKPTPQKSESEFDLSQKESKPITLTSKPEGDGNLLKAGLIFLIGGIFFFFFIVAVIVTLVRSKRLKAAKAKASDEVEAPSPDPAAQEAKEKASSSDEEQKQPTLSLPSKKRKSPIVETTSEEAPLPQPQQSELPGIPESQAPGDPKIEFIEQTEEAEADTAPEASEDENQLEISLTEGTAEPEEIVEAATDQEKPDLKTKLAKESHPETESEPIESAEEQEIDTPEIAQQKEEACIEESVTEMIETSAEKAVEVIEEAVSEYEEKETVEEPKPESSESEPVATVKEKAEAVPENSGSTTDASQFAAPEPKLSLAIRSSNPEPSKESQGHPINAKRNRQSPDGSSPYSRAPRKKLHIKGKKD